MKLTKLTIYTLVLTTLILCTISCTTSTDDITNASPKDYKHASVTLPPASDDYIVHGEKPGIKNFVIQYDNNLYRGGKPTSPEGVNILKDMGIKTIVSITPTDMEREEAKKHGIKLVEISVDKKEGISQKDLNRYIDLFSTKDNLPIYVHCNGGSHRAGTMGTAYRVHKNGWKWERAVKEFDNLGGSPDDDIIILNSIKIMRK